MDHRHDDVEQFPLSSSSDMVLMAFFGFFLATSLPPTDSFFSSNCVKKVKPKPSLIFWKYPLELYGFLSIAFRLELWKWSYALKVFVAKLFLFAESLAENFDTVLSDIIIIDDKQKVRLSNYAEMNLKVVKNARH